MEKNSKVNKQQTIEKAIKTGFVMTQDNQKIYYDHYQSGCTKLVIIAHGFFNSKESTLLKALGKELNEKYDVLIMDFRGHGKSPGLFYWTTKEYLDLEAVLEYAHKQYEKIGVIGFSLGAATSIITASRTNLIDSLVAISAPTEFEKIEFHFWELDAENDIFYNLIGSGREGKGVRPGPFWMDKEKPISVVEKINSPVLYIHGATDWLIKPWHSQVLYDKTKSPKRINIINNGPHAEYLMRKNKQETVIAIQEWFKQTL